MKWQKKGLIFCPDGHTEWSKTHAQIPTVLVLPDRLRVFFSSRNQFGKSQTGFLDVDIENPSKILYLHPEPVFSFGKPGTFDDDGVMPGSLILQDDRLFLYYTGWNQRVTTSYHLAIGLASSCDHGLSFQRNYEGPVIERALSEPYLVAAPCVLHEKDAWKMWYISGTKWELIENKYEPVYVIKYAHSADGIHWQRPNITCIPQLHENEAFAAPCVLKIKDVYHMWYCYRGSIAYRNGGKGGYRIGYASSKDGIAWERKDEEVGIGLSENGWDSEMMCYPYIVKVDDKLIMFYNGNGFGKTGVGYAILNQLP